MNYTNPIHTTHLDHSLTLRGHEHRRQWPTVFSPIERVDRPCDLPLSFQQEGMWRAQKRHSTLGCNIVRAVRLRGVVNIPALHFSINEIVRRHDALRATFANTDSGIRQTIRRHADLEIPVFDFAGCSGSMQEARTMGEREAARPFDLAIGPLLRAAIGKLDKSDYVLMLVLHRIACDRWSLAIVQRELESLYNTVIAGKAPKVAALAIQYHDFAVWQRARMESGDFDGQISYWHGRLAGTTDPFAPSIKRSAVEEGTSGIEQIRVSRELTEGAKRLSKKERVTLFTALLASLAIVLYKYTEQVDVVIGNVLAIRFDPFLEPLIGRLINVLPIRMDLSGNPNGREILRRVFNCNLDAYQNRDVSLSHVRATAPSLPDPLYRVTFNFTSTPGFSGLRLSGATQVSFPLLSGIVSDKFLDVRMRESDGELVGAVTYNTELFQEVPVRGILSDFLVVLQQLVVTPGKLLSQIRTTGYGFPSKTI